MSYVGPMSPEELPVVHAFRDLTEKYKIWQKMLWKGVPIAKTPEDCWLYQETIFDLRPALIVEFGTHLGGSALFFADMMDLAEINRARVLTIDKLRHERMPSHHRIDYLTAHSRSDEAVAAVRKAVDNAGGPILFIEDSLHTPEHTAGELELYADLVTPGSWFVVEDCGWPDQTMLIQDVMADFLRRRTDFAVDVSKGKFLLTLAPGGWLKRVR